MITKKIRQDILKHYKQEYPRESCGFVVDDFYYPCDNISPSDNDFMITPKQYLEAKKLGEIRAIVHSHPDGKAEPSMLDKVQINHHGIAWIITNGHEIKTHYPDSYKAPLIGREYHHGVLDCYSIVQDYYSRELGIKLNDFERADLWWENPKSPSLYVDNFAAEGFVEVEQPQQHDLIITRVGRTYHPNHAVIFLGDSGELKSEQSPKVFGSDLILHHPYERQSLREIYGRQWQNRTAHILRHKSLIE